MSKKIEYFIEQVLDETAGDYEQSVVVRFLISISFRFILAFIFFCIKYIRLTRIKYL